MEKYMFVDFETIGLDYREHEPTEIAFVITDERGNVEKEYSQLIKLPEGKTVPEFITGLTGITDELLNESGKDLTEVRKEVHELLEGNEVVIGHHVTMELSYLRHYFGIKPDKFICTRHMWHTHDNAEKAGLEAVYLRHIGPIEQDHRALNDVYMLKDIFFKWDEVTGQDKKRFYNVLERVNGRTLQYIPGNTRKVI